MMIYPSVDELMKKFDSRYSIVIATAKRARELEDKENSQNPWFTQCPKSLSRSRLKRYMPARSATA